VRLPKEEKSMRSISISNVVITGFVAVGLALCGCGSSGGNTNVFGSGGSSGSGSGGSGSGGSASGSGGSSSGSGGNATGGISGSGGSGSGGAAPIDGGGSGGAAPGDGGGSDVVVMGNDVTKPRPTAGCGKAPMGTGQQTIMTMGTKQPNCADHGVCGPWMYNRSYNVILPAGYVNTKPYELLFQGPGCGGNAQGVYGLNGTPAIRVGLTPPPNAINHATNPNQGCFDDKEGDDSVDWVFYEALWDRLAGQLCFDQNRVFASGDSSGAWFSNEVGCKYAGDAKHPIRGIMPNTGGLPSNPIWEPTCTNNPLAGIWMGDLSDPDNPFSNNIFGIQRAMKVNGCATQTYSDANTDPFPIGGGNAANQCKKVKGCPDLWPIIVCTVNNGTHDSHSNMALPGFTTFLNMFDKAPFTTP
jgi:poly(3-hydroxybutyrate) depolymerase